VFENRVLGRIFGPKRKEVIKDWRRLHNEKINDLYYSPNIIRVKKIKKNVVVWSCSTYGREERYINGFGGDI
jgi:hypothetical protein